MALARRKKKLEMKFLSTHTYIALFSMIAGVAVAFIVIIVMVLFVVSFHFILFRCCLLPLPFFLSISLLLLFLSCNTACEWQSFWRDYNIFILCVATAMLQHIKKERKKESKQFFLRSLIRLTRRLRCLVTWRNFVGIIFSLVEISTANKKKNSTKSNSNKNERQREIPFFTTRNQKSIPIEM